MEEKPPRARVPQRSRARPSDARTTQGGAVSGRPWRLTCARQLSERRQRVPRSSLSSVGTHVGTRYSGSPKLGPAVSSAFQEPGSSRVFFVVVVVPLSFHLVRCLHIVNVLVRGFCSSERCCMVYGGMPRGCSAKQVSDGIRPAELCNTGACVGR